MTAERVERRRAAELAADVVGYSRLMGADEEGTLARFTLSEIQFLVGRRAALLAPLWSEISQSSQ